MTVSDERLAEHIAVGEGWSAMRSLTAGEVRAVVTELQSLRAAAKVRAIREGGEVAILRQGLRFIAEGNLGDDPWQANYDRIRATAVAHINATQEGK